MYFGNVLICVSQNVMLNNIICINIHIDLYVGFCLLVQTISTCTYCEELKNESVKLCFIAFNSDTEIIPGYESLSVFLVLVKRSGVTGPADSQNIPGSNLPSITTDNTWNLLEFRGDHLTTRLMNRSKSETQSNTINNQNLS